MIINLIFLIFLVISHYECLDWKLTVVLGTSRIHVAVQGLEIDRIMEPIINSKADKAHILIFRDEKTERFMKQHRIIKENLEKNKIEVETVGVEIHDYNDLIQTFSKIIKTERKQHESCEIFLNLSVGTKISAIAGMDACRLWGCTPYYVIPEEYAPENQAKESLSKGVKEIIHPPLFEMVKPENNLIEALKLLDLKKGWMYKKEFKKKLLEKKMLRVQKKYADPKEQAKVSAEYMALNHQYIKPLEDAWKFIQQEKVGRNIRLTITNRGREALEIFKYLE